MASYLLFKPDGTVYPFHEDFARMPEMVLCDAKGNILPTEPTPAPPEPEPVHKPAPPKLGRAAKPVVEPTHAPAAHTPPAHAPTPAPAAPLTHAPIPALGVMHAFEPTPLDSLPDAKNILGEDFVQ